MAIVNGSLQEGYKDAAWFAANPTLVLLVGQKVNLEQTGTYKLGDGTSQLSALSFLGASGSGLSGLTTNKVLKATSSTTAGDSNITDDGTNVVVNGLRIRSISNATYFNASGVNGHYWNSFNDAINLFRVKNDGVVNIPQGTSDRIMALDTNKDVVYLSTTTYPSLTELSYGKGVTSSIQTQLNNKGSSTPVYSTKWLTAPFATLPNSIGNFAGAIFYIPISVSKTMTLTDLRMEVTAGVAASNIRLAIYNDNNGAPSTLLDQSTAISSAVIGQKDYTLVSPITIQASDQKFWLAVQASANGVGLRSSASGVCLNLLAGSGGTGVMSYEIQAFGAFPATSTPTLNPSQQVILMAAKLQ